MSFSDFINPIDKGFFAKKYNPNQLGSKIINYDGNKLPANSIALIGVCEDRNSPNKGCASAPNYIREYLYQLIHFEKSIEIIDLGDIKNTSSPQETYEAMGSITNFLKSKKILPIFIGGTKDLTYGNFLGYKEAKKSINLVVVDSTINTGNTDQEMCSSNFLSKIILHEPNFLFNYSNIGYQSYFVDTKEKELIKTLYFDAYRLGSVQKKAENIEPIVRNADVLSFSASAIRQAECPANKEASANGFYGDEACQITRYAGLSDRLTSVGFYDINPSNDLNGHSGKLMAQMIWYFIDGVTNRQGDYPLGNEKEHTKYNVSIQEGKNEIVFYKSNKSERWWMEIFPPSSAKEHFKENIIIPCSHEDYQTACKNEVPNKWWQAFQKLSS